MKMPAQSRILASEAAVARDKQAKAALEARGEPFTVPAFAEAMAAILAREVPVHAWAVCPKCGGRNVMERLLRAASELTCGLCGHQWIGYGTGER